MSPVASTMLRMRGSVASLGKYPSLVTGLVILAIAALVCFVLPLFVVENSTAMDMQNRFLPPLSGGSLLGTDEYGRSVLARLLEGGRTSLLVGMAVAVLATVAGMVVGLMAAYYPILDQILMRIADGLLAIPGMLLAIGLMAALGPNAVNVVIAMTIVSTPVMARLVRSRALAIKEEAFIDALRVQRASDIRILFRHIAPNCVSVVAVHACFIFADAIITEAALSFLGAGVPPPAPSWGNMLYDGKNAIFNGWWIAGFPAFIVAVTTIALTMVGDGLRDMFDPKGQRPRGRFWGLLIGRKEAKW